MSRLKSIIGFILSGLGIIGVIAGLLALEGLTAVFLWIAAGALLLVGLALLMRELRPVDIVRAEVAMRKAGVLSFCLSGSAGNRMARAIEAADRVRIMASSALSFTRAYRESLVHAIVENKADIKLMTGRKGSEFINELEEVEPSRSGSSLDQEIQNTIDEFRTIVYDAREEASCDSTIGRAFHGTYIALLRSTFILCIGRDSKMSRGWLTITLPPKRCAEDTSVSLWLSGEGKLFSDCLRAFEAAWDMASHRGEVVELVEQENAGKSGDTAE